jgi:hypothetical protein
MMADKLRVRAQGCWRLAAQARDRFRAADYEDLAQQWRHMAEQVEELWQTSTAPLAKPAGGGILPMNSKARLHYDLKKAMSEEVVRRHLAEAERHIQAGARTLDRQRRTVARLEAIGRDTGNAKALLATLEEIQNTFLLHREMVLSELSCLERPIHPHPTGARGRRWGFFDKQPVV